MLPQTVELNCLKMNRIYKKYINIRDIFNTFYSIKSRTMVDMLNILLEGHHHSGIDDCRNIAKII